MKELMGNYGHIGIITGALLFIIGVWGIISRRHIIKMIISFSVLDTGIHVILVSIGYIKGRTAPIVNDAVDKAEAAQSIVDPLPQALVLTAIVIGVGITALMLSYALKLYNANKTLEINKFKELKW
jgi:multicomponent Na+:H+ antiporter subunit C